MEGKEILFLQRNPSVCSRRMTFSSFLVPQTWDCFQHATIKHSLTSPYRSQKVKEPNCPFTSESHFSFSYEYWHHMKQTIGCGIRKIQASQNVPKENQMIKTIKNNTTQNKTKEWQIFTASICNGTWVLLSAEHKIRDVHFSIGGVTDGAGASQFGGRHSF